MSVVDLEVKQTIDPIKLDSNNINLIPQSNEPTTVKATTKYTFCRLNNMIIEEGPIDRRIENTH